MTGSRFWTVCSGVACVVLPLAALLAAGVRGALDIARVDDWSYLSLVFGWHENTDLALNGWVHMFFVTQGLTGLFVTLVAGESILALQLSVLAVSFVGLASVFVLASFLVAKRYAFFTVLATGLSPLWLHLSVTYMTDVPAWTLSAVSVCLGVVSIQRRSYLMICLGTLVALLGFGVREYAVVPYLALLTWVCLSNCPKKFRLWSLILGLVTLTICTAAYLWRRELAGSVETVTMSPIESSVLYSKLLLTLALLLAPYTALGAVLMWSRRRLMLPALLANWRGAAAGTVIAVGIVVLSGLQFAGNVIHPYGSSWTSAGDGVRSFPLWGFRTVTLIGVLSLVVLLALVGMIMQRRMIAQTRRALEQPMAFRNTEGLYAFVSAAVMAVYFVAIFVAGLPAFDRYLLLVVPLIGIVILWLATRSLKEGVSRWQKFAIAGILAATGTFGLVITDGLNQVDGLRWQVASEVMEAGIPAYRVDGGDAWFRYHQRGAPGVAQVGSLENSIPGRTWWQTFFEGSTFCRMVAIESETDLQAMYGPALSIREERTLVGTPFRVMVFRGPDPC